MASKRAVITGLGAVSCIGNSVNEMWRNLISGHSGISTITAFDPAGFSCRIAGEVKSLELPSLSAKEKRRMARFHLLAAAAAEEALRHAGIDPADPLADGTDPFRFGVIAGNAAGGVDIYDRNLLALHERGCGAVSALFLPLYIVNSVSGMLAIRFKARGVNFTPVSACATGCHAIGEAYKSILCGQADMILAGGSEACISPGLIAGFQALTALSCRNSDPARANRPFDRDRDGFVLAEGAGFLVLEELEHAKKRGAEILAEISGYGATCDAYHITSPAPDGSADARAMRDAIFQAGIIPEQVGYLCAHGTGTVVNDLYESRAINAAFGEYAATLPVSSIKSMTGHTLSAAGALESIACIMAIRENTIPPTANCDHIDPECRINVVCGKARHCQVDYALNNALGFGGHNAALIFNRYKEM